MRARPRRRPTCAGPGWSSEPVGALRPHPLARRVPERRLGHRGRVQLAEGLDLHALAWRGALGGQVAIGDAPADRVALIRAGDVAGDFTVDEQRLVAEQRHRGVVERQASEASSVRHRRRRASGIGGVERQASEASGDAGRARPPQRIAADEVALAQFDREAQAGLVRVVLGVVGSDRSAFSPFERWVSPARPPNRTCNSRRIRLSICSCRWNA